MDPHTSPEKRRNSADVALAGDFPMAPPRGSCLSCLKSGRQVMKPLSDHLFRTPSWTGPAAEIIGKRPGLCLWRLAQRCSARLSRFPLSWSSQAASLFLSETTVTKGRAEWNSDQSGSCWPVWPDLQLAAKQPASRLSMAARPAWWPLRSPRATLPRARRSVRPATWSIVRHIPTNVTDVRVLGRPADLSLNDITVGGRCARRGRSRSFDPKTKDGPCSRRS